MKWITIKTKNLPIIALQIDRAIQVFESLAERASMTRKREDELQLEDLRAQFKNRIAQLDIFYRQHCLEEGIAIFHMLKIKLQRSIFRVNPKMDQTSRFTDLSFAHDHQNLFPEHQIKLIDEPLFSYYETALEKNSDLEHNNKDSIKQYSLSNVGSKVSAKMGQAEKPVKPIAKQRSLKANRPIIAQNMPKKKVASPVRFKTEHTVKEESEREDKSTPTSRWPTSSNISEAIATNKNKKPTKNTVSKLPVKQVSASNAGSDNHKFQLSQENELKFTIKMTKQEYRSLLQMKKKLQKQAKF